MKFALIVNCKKILGFLGPYLDDKAMEEGVARENGRWRSCGLAPHSMLLAVEGRLMKVGPPLKEQLEDPADKQDPRESKYMSIPLVGDLPRSSMWR